MVDAGDSNKFERKSSTFFPYPFETETRKQLFLIRWIWNVTMNKKMIGIVPTLPGRQKSLARHDKTPEKVKLPKSGWAPRILNACQKEMYVKKELGNKDGPSHPSCV